MTNDQSVLLTGESVTLKSSYGNADYVAHTHDTRDGMMAAVPAVRPMDDMSQMLSHLVLLLGFL